MESYLKNIEVWCWAYTENVRNYLGLHLTARADACDALVECLSQLRQEGNGARRTIPLLDLAPEHAAKIAGNQKYVSFSKIRISLHESSDSLRQMSFRREGNQLFSISPYRFSGNWRKVWRMFDSVRETTVSIRMTIESPGS